MLEEQFLKIAQEYDGLAAEVESSHVGTTSPVAFPREPQSAFSTTFQTP